LVNNSIVVEFSKQYIQNEFSLMIELIFTVEWVGGELIGEKVCTVYVSLLVYCKLYTYKTKYASFIFSVHITGSIRVAICCSLGSSEDY
jgi:hypothetical protein